MVAAGVLAKVSERGREGWFWVGVRRVLPGWMCHSKPCICIKGEQHSTWVQIGCHSSFAVPITVPSRVSNYFTTLKFFWQLPTAWWRFALTVKEHCCNPTTKKKPPKNTHERLPKIKRERHCLLSPQGTASASTLMNLPVAVLLPWSWCLML